MAFDPFHSRRLVYRAIEDSPEDEAFLHSIRLDIESLSADNIHLLIPQGKAQTKKLSEILRNNALLGAMICKASPASDETASSDGVPVPIGFVAIGKPHPNGVHSRRLQTLQVRRDAHDELY